MLCIGNILMSSNCWTQRVVQIDITVNEIHVVVGNGCPVSVNHGLILGVCLVHIELNMFLAHENFQSWQVWITVVEITFGSCCFSNNVITAEYKAYSSVP